MAHTPHVELEAFDYIHLAGQARIVGPMARANADRLERYYPHLPENYRNQLNTARSIARVVRAGYKNAQIVRVDGQPAGVASRIDGQTVTNKFGKIHSGVNVAYWLIQELDSSDCVHEAVAGVVIEEGVEHAQRIAQKTGREIVPVFGALDAEGVREDTEPSRGLLMHERMKVLGAQSIASAGGENVDNVVLPDVETIIAVTSNLSDQG